MKQFLLIIIILTFCISGFSQNPTSNPTRWKSTFENEQKQPGLKIYPNPVKNQKVTVELINQKFIEIKLTNIAGKEILLKKFVSGVGKHLLHLENIPNGIYLIQVKTNENKAVVKKLLVSAN